MVEMRLMKLKKKVCYSKCHIDMKINDLIYFSWETDFDKKGRDVEFGTDSFDRKEKNTNKSLIFHSWRKYVIT